ncbi:hypothetical protein AN414_13865 [Serratia marcescens]|nr:hypothetical protein AN414_13865 [Serratia marcescens]
MRWRAAFFGGNKFSSMQGAGGWNEQHEMKVSRLILGGIKRVYGHFQQYIKSILSVGSVKTWIESGNFVMQTS